MVQLALDSELALVLEPAFDVGIRTGTCFLMSVLCQRWNRSGGITFTLELDTPYLIWLSIPSPARVLGPHAVCGPASDRVKAQVR